MEKEAFGEYNPIVCFIFFIGTIVMGMCFMHPLFTIASILCGVIYLFVIKGKDAVKTISGIFGLMFIITFINPIFNTHGRHVLFRLFGRAYTLESLIYGAVLGSMVAGVFIWFACYNEVMSSEKFIYLFGRILPSVSLILSMVLRLIPNFQKKSKQIIDARAAIGMAGSSSLSKKEKVQNGATVVGALTNWALEGGIVTADSMRARGYGTAKRSSYLRYRFDKRNAFLAVIMTAAIIAIIVLAACNAAYAEYIPVLTLTWVGNPVTLSCLIIYVVFMLIPTGINIKEILLWRSLRSKI